MRCNIIGYHTNDEKRVSEFIANRTDVINSEDTCWLGYGMYFWDNKSNTEYWLKEKIRKEKGQKYSILKANLCIDKILDLTDLNTLNEMENLWNSFCEKSGHKKNCTLGKKIDLLFKFYDNLPRNYSIIKVFGRYVHTPRNNFIRMRRHSIVCEPIYDIKVIYCVKDKSIISNQEHIKL